MADSQRPGEGDADRRPLNEHMQADTPQGPRLREHVPAPGETAPTTEWRYCQRCRCRLAERYDPDHMPRCPECRLPYDPLDNTTYDTLPAPAAWKSRLAVFALVIMFGIGAYWTIWELSRMDVPVALGSALFLAMPFSIGALLGFFVRPGLWLAMVFSLIAVPTIVLAVMCIGLHGTFCGITLSVIFTLPALVGAVTGALLRVVFYNSAWDGRRYFFLAGFALLPFVVDQVDRKVFPMEEDLAEVRTAAVFPTSATAAWDSILFYEEVEHEAPWLVRRTLPQPLRAEGSKQAVGDVERCVYKQGHLVKVISERVEGERLAFRVVEQRLRIERNVSLQDGAFLLEPIDARHTRVILTTRYHRHLRPAWLWQPTERKVVHLLHGHVLEGMRRRAEQGSPSGELPELLVTRQE
jgi:hypothetical protein